MACKCNFYTFYKWDMECVMLVHKKIYACQEHHFVPDPSVAWPCELKRKKQVVKEKVSKWKK